MPVASTTVNSIVGVGRLAPGPWNRLADRDSAGSNGPDNFGPQRECAGLGLLLKPVITIIGMGSGRSTNRGQCQDAPAEFRRRARAWRAAVAEPPPCFHHRREPSSFRPEIHRWPG